MKLPLEGIKMVEYGVFHAGPGGGGILGDLGAEVIKIENSKGDPMRQWEKTGAYNFGLPDGNSAMFVTTNRNKKSICIQDITKGKGKEIFHRLVKEADVFLTNLRKSTKPKLGIDYESISKINPMIIHVNVSGYGPEGPLEDHGAFDPLGQARSGVSYITGSERPTLLQIGVIDQMTAISASYSIILGLLVRELRGFGQELHVSLYSASMWLTYPNFMLKTLLDIDAGVKWERERHPVGRNIFQCKDGRWIISCVHGEEKNWPRLCEAVGRKDLITDERFATPQAREAHNPEVVKIFDEIFLEKTAKEWEEHFVDKRLFFCTAQKVEEVLSDSQALVSDYINELEYPDPRIGKVKIPGFPIHLSKCERPRTQSFGPKLGEHTETVLRDIGYADQEILALKDEGVVK
jgi:crotonobetainyl-CoA:carnitine CoA-transferase CaiB-like acyl-CoA transferase